MSSPPPKHTRTHIRQRKKRICFFKGRIIVDERLNWVKTDRKVEQRPLMKIVR